MTVQSWEAMDGDTATFTPDITPLILAAHTDNYEVIKILLDRGAVMPTPHHQRCSSLANVSLMVITIEFQMRL